ncbi:ATP-dependent zinc metalloprotease FtsH [Christensenellaceae bacterium OttesenSCG-928-L17]|nr:ATP-dependent zinc metalloprotease FtsH [Christensenellaceae bacterium OttesenSCG-928-L17]
MKRNIGTPLIYLVLLVVVVLMATRFFPMRNEPDKMEYSEFLEAVRTDKVAAVNITTRNLVGLYKEGSLFTKDQLPDNYDFSVIIPSETTFNKDMSIIAAEKNPDISVDMITSADYSFDYQSNTPKEAGWFATLLPYLLMIGLLAVFYYFMMQQQGGGSKVMNFGKSRARVQLDGQTKVTFDDVAGADEEKAELKEVVDFMRDPKRFNDIGARIPKGVLLVGPPGTGKTLLAKAVAGEARVPFFSISGSDFVEMFVGVGASRVRDLFNTAKKSTPAVLFIDEIDAVGRQRGAGMGGGHDEREQTLNQLLVEMDGFAPNEGIIVIAATNRPDILDPALLRPGRFDRQITVNYPDVKGREAILKVHARNKPFTSDVDLAVLAKRTPGFTGADLENVLNEGAILTARAHKRQIGMLELEEAITRVIAGPEKKSRVITEKDKEITAYHETGHAIVAFKLPYCDPVHEVSIIPRGMAAGYTMTLPKEDMMHVTRNKLLDEIAMLLSGRVAESITFGDISTGAYNDLQRATDIARKMVVEYGMTDEIGPMFLGGESEVFIAKDWGHQRNFSEELASRIDKEIRRILDEQFARAKDCLLSESEALERVAHALLEHERIDGDEFELLFKGEEVEVGSARKAAEEEAARLAAEYEAREKEERAKRDAEKAAREEQQQNEPPTYGSGPVDLDDTTRMRYEFLQEQARKKEADDENSENDDA